MGMELRYADNEQEIRVVDRDDDEDDNVDSFSQFARLVGSVIRKAEFSRPSQVLALIVDHMNDVGNLTPFPGATREDAARLNDSWERFVIAAQELNASWEEVTANFFTRHAPDAGRGDETKGDE